MLTPTLVLLLSLSMQASAQSVPAVSLSATDISFNGKMVVFTTSGPKGETLTNSGTASLSITSITASGDFAAANDCGSSLAPGNKCKITVTFTPTAAGSRNGVVTIVHNAPGNPHMITLSGTGVEPATVSPTSLSFGSRVVGVAGSTLGLKLKNNQTVALNIAGITASGDYFATNDCGVSLAPGATCTINVSFIATAMGVRSGLLSIIHSAILSPEVIPLSGTGIVNLTLSSSLNFGSQTVGVTGSAQTATLTNSSSIPIAITSIVSSGDFTQTNTCGVSLAAGGSCTISVRFSPAATGARTGAVTITDAATNSPQVLSLTGNGVAPPVTVSPGSLTFDRQLAGTESAAKSVTMTNTGNGNVNNIAVGTTGDFQQTNNCPASLASGASCVINVYFTPTAPGNRIGSVTISNSAGNSPQVVSLSGFGYALTTIQVTPADPTIWFGQTKQFTATGSYTDGTTQNLTNSAMWSSSAPGVAGNHGYGRFSGQGSGMTTISAASGPVAGQTTLTVKVAFTFTGTMNTGRSGHTATLLNNGKVLIAGGMISTTAGYSASTELYDPATGLFTPTGSMMIGRYQHQAVLMNDGTVLVVGGATATAEIYDPTTGSFTAVGSMSTYRIGPTLTVLKSGKVLATGGYGSPGTAEVYDPVGRTFHLCGSMLFERTGHTATLLADGRVLIAGNQVYAGSPTVAEVFDPLTESFSATGSMVAVRGSHAATLLNDGKVLLSGGSYMGTVSGVRLRSAELYDPATGIFTAVGDMLDTRVVHTSTLLSNGMILIAGGYNQLGGGTPIAGAEIYDPVSRSFSSIGNMRAARWVHRATLLPSGRLLLTGGYDAGYFIPSAELFEPETLAPAGLVSITVTPATATISPTAAQQFVATGRFADNSTRILTSVSWSSSWPAVATVSNDESNSGMAAAAASGAATVSASAGTVTGSAMLAVRSPGFIATGMLGTARYCHTATLLNNGKVLLAGGMGAPEQYLTTAELYDPTTGLFTPTGSMSIGRYEHRATLLANGKVLIAGGRNPGATAIAELYDPATGLFTRVADMSFPRFSHTLTLLGTGKVLVAGGLGFGYPATAELFDPATNTFTLTGTMSAGRGAPAAVLLMNGKVLIAGGQNGTILATAELYDPATGTFSPTGSMSYAWHYASGTLLNSGKVLIAGGQPYTAAAQLYDPASGTFSPTGSMTVPRDTHTATKLSNGKVLIVAGFGGEFRSSAELYDPSTGLFSAAGNMSTKRYFSTATLLGNGTVLIAGGFDSVASGISAELY
ncbi:MAG: choice-of-anchor D domain-containing protein [Acidobacteria bacterium]|nr:choice-of-anchor D domain-containing protein [Acidobacteriota bacterium]